MKPIVVLNLVAGVCILALALLDGPPPWPVYVIISINLACGAAGCVLWRKGWYE